MPSVQTLAPLAALFSGAVAQTFGAPFADPVSCPGGLPASCQNSTAVQNTCCFITAGLLTLTQFWDTDPVTGPDDSWTIHGLWPDWCDGSYPADCDPSRAYTDIGGILTANGADATLSYMETYWKDYQGDDEDFWQHEWSKHGTCISTLEPECYEGYSDEEEAVAYFDRAVSLFKSLPTYEWLAEAGITPSSSATYSLNEILAPLQAQHGAEVYVDCDGGALNEVWYFYNVQGSLQEGTFEPVDTPSYGGCSGSIKYLPK